jgi:hypothetical protein
MVVSCAMRRAELLLVIFALLATPLALLGRALSCESASCPMLCCLPHASHSPHGAQMPCHCSGKSHKLPNFGLIAPIAPTAPSEFASLDQPRAAQESLSITSASARQGFSVAPFTPPRH